MSPTKRFLLILAVVSLAVWLGINFLFGPPGFSGAYLEQHKTEHGRYLEIAKDEAFQRYMQRPHLVDNPEMAEQAAFVEAYTSQPEFQREQRRRWWYTFLFDTFNAALVVVIAVRFMTKPLLSFLDERIADLREKMESAAKAREEAQARCAAANEKIDQLPRERQRLETETEERIGKELAELRQDNERSLELLRNEIEDRKRGEEVAAARMLKREIVTQAVEQLKQDFVARQSAEQQAAIFDQFVGDLERRSS